MKPLPASSPLRVPAPVRSGRAALLVVRGGDSSAAVVDVLRRLRAALPHSGIVVETASAHTADLARAAARELGGIAVLAHGREGGGVTRWARAEGYESIVELPADGTIEPAGAVALLRALDRADVVLGVRARSGRDDGHGRPPARGVHLVSRLAGTIAGVARGWRDPLSPARAYHLDVLDAGGHGPGDLRAGGRGALDLLAAAHDAGGSTTEVSVPSMAAATSFGAVVRASARDLGAVVVWTIESRRRGLRRRYHHGRRRGE